MDDKAKFQNIQSKLERYLYEYKNSFPKNIWQLISVDFPLITLIITAIVIIELLGVGIISIMLIVLLSLPYFIVNFTKSGGLWQRLLNKRKNFKAHHAELINKIQQVETEDLQAYPDVKNYLENYHREVEKETVRKQAIRKKYIILMILGIICLIGFCVFTLNVDTRLRLRKPKTTAATPLKDTDTLANVYYNGEFYNYFKLTPNAPIASIKPMPSIFEDIINPNDSCNLDIYFVECEQPFLRAKMPHIANTLQTVDSCIFRLTITNQIGKTFYGMPCFDFVYRFHQPNPKIIDSYPIVSPAENHPYEIVRRVKYLQENAENLRYKIEKLD